MGESKLKRVRAEAVKNLLDVCFEGLCVTGLEGHPFILRFVPQLFDPRPSAKTDLRSPPHRLHLTMRLVWRRHPESP